MHQGKIRRFSGLTFLLVLLTQITTSHAQQPPGLQRVLIETSKPYDGLVRAIEASGGRVLHQYEYVNGIAAELSDEGLDSIRPLIGTAAITRDVDIVVPSPLAATRLRSVTLQQSEAIVTEPSNAQLSRVDNIPELAAEHPGVYALNNAGTQIEKLHAMGLTGQGTIVAVIDSGLRPGYKLLFDSIAGGMDFVDDGPPGPAGDTRNDWSKSTNDGHGTFAAGLIAGNAEFPLNGVLQDALELYAPEAIVDDELPLIGTAPESKIYVVRVFGATGGTTVGTIIAAIQHVIDQRDLYDRTGGRQGVKIDVVNLSLGISTLAAGRTLFDQSVDALLDAGIVPVVSGGNVGPSTLTTSSPGSSFSAVTVGGSSRAVSERLMAEIQFATQSPGLYYPGIGADIRPFNGTEIAWFASRGPNADGRLDPDVVASAVGNIGQGYCPQLLLDACYKRLSIASGTSFSAPIVSGIAAVLVQAFPNATATQIRNAIIASGRINQIEDYFDVLDRGQGLPDAWAAWQLLDSGAVPDTLPPVNIPDDLVRDNIEDNTDLTVVSGFVSQSFENQKPGARAEILYEVPQRAERVIVRVSNVEMSGPQNVFYGGDSLFFYVHSAKTSSIGAFGNYLVNGELFLNGDPNREFVLERPDTGIMRITLNPDTLNAGLVSADVTVETILEAWPNEMFSGTIAHGETKLFALEVQPGTARLEFLLTWDHDWAHYPTSDVDMVVCSPDIPATVDDCRALGNRQGATLAGPERVTIDNPAPGNWTILVRGFNVPPMVDNFQLRIGN